VIKISALMFLVVFFFFWNSMFNFGSVFKIVNLE